jgi:hypothetical protein
MPLPTFLIIGAQKSGTTWLAHNLRQHPEVFMPEQEIHYFDKDFNFKKGVEWYEKHFAGAEGEKAIGEKTPDYLWANGRGVEGHLPDVHLNIHNTLPEAKLIVVLRNPVERAVAAVNHIICSGRISPFHNMDELLLGRKRHLVEGHGVIDYGMYYRQIKAYQEHFAPGRMLFLIFEEDVVQDPASGLKKACEFLEIDPSFEFRDRERKIGEIRCSTLGLALGYYLPFMRSLSRRMDRYLPAARRRPSREVIRKLYRIYENENEKLFDLTGLRPVSWFETKDVV